MTESEGDKPFLRGRESPLTFLLKYPLLYLYERTSEANKWGDDYPYP